jgi:hypothetical protein
MFQEKKGLVFHLLPDGCLRTVAGIGHRIRGQVKSLSRMFSISCS